MHKKPGKGHSGTPGKRRPGIAFRYAPGTFNHGSRETSTPSWPCSVQAMGKIFSSVFPTAALLEISIFPALIKKHLEIFTE